MKRLWTRILPIVPYLLLGASAGALLSLFEDDPNRANAFAALGSLIAMALAYAAIDSQRRLAKRERRDRQLNEIIDWAVRTHGCVSDRSRGIVNPDLTARWDVLRAVQTGIPQLASSTKNADIITSAQDAMNKFDAVAPLVAAHLDKKGAADCDACMKSCEALILTAQRVKAN